MQIPNAESTKWSLWVIDYKTIKAKRCEPASHPKMGALCAVAVLAFVQSAQHQRQDILFLLFLAFVFRQYFWVFPDHALQAGRVAAK